LQGDKLSDNGRYHRAEAVTICAILNAAKCSVSASKTIRSVLGAFITGGKCPTMLTVTRREEEELLVMTEYQAPEGGSWEAVLLEAMVPCPDVCSCCVRPLKTVPSPA